MSGNTKYTDLFNDVLPDVPGVGLDLAQNAIMNVVIDFCNASNVWRVFADPQDVIAGQSTYDLEPPSGADVAQLMALSIAGHRTPITAISEDMLLTLDPDWQSQTGRPRNYLAQDTETVILYPVPDCTETAALRMTLSLQPRRTSQFFPSWIWTQYYAPLIAGAKANLLAMPKKPWSDPKLAMYHQSIYDAGVAQALADSTRSIVRTTLRTTSFH